MDKLTRLALAHHSKQLGNWQVAPLNTGGGGDGSDEDYEQLCRDIAALEAQMEADTASAEARIAAQAAQWQARTEQAFAEWRKSRPR